PVSADRALPQMVSGDAVQIVSPNRGDSDRMAQFFFTPSVTKVAVANAGDPWNGSIHFRASFESSFRGGVEVDESGKNATKPVEGVGFLSHSFREAARYWAAP